MALGEIWVVPSQGHLQRGVLQQGANLPTLVLKTAQMAGRPAKHRTQAQTFDGIPNPTAKGCQVVGGARVGGPAKL